MLRPKIGLDWDDVTAPFNSIAIASLSLFLRIHHGTVATQPLTAFMLKVIYESM